MEQLESNVYILTELIQQYFYTYLYHEAGYLDSLQAALTARLWLELGLVAVGALVLVGGAHAPLGGHQPQHHAADLRSARARAVDRPGRHCRAGAGRGRG